MDKILERLYDRAINGDDRASDLFEAMENMGPEQLASFVAVNDSTLQDVLGLNRSMMDKDLKEEDKALMDAYYSLRNTGVTNYIKPVGAERADVYGRPMHSLDEYMQAFGVSPADNLEISDDDRAYFTNPEHPNYWKNRPENERRAVANKMGFQDLRELDEYLDRASQEFQGRNQAEGWDANNKIDIPTFAASTIGGFVFPRVKEAKLEGNEPGFREYAGDISENALSLVPGLGSTKIVSKVPRVGGKIAGSTVGQVAGTAFDQVAQPLASQAIDAGILYNPDVLGNPGDELNLRSRFSLPAVAAQGAGIAGVKGLAKQGASVAKNFAETRYGKTSGGQLVKDILTPIENVNEKTDDLIARRQAVLDRKAELASNRDNVALPGDKDIPSANSASVDDLKKANTFRILNSEAERIANSEDARKAYRQMFAKSKARGEFHDAIFDTMKPLFELGGRVTPARFPASPDKFISIPINDGQKLLLPADTPFEKIQEALSRAQEARRKLMALDNSPMAKTARGYKGRSVNEQLIMDYKTANEQSPIQENLVQLPDGNIALGEWVNDGTVRYPGTDYSIKLEGKPTPLEYQYESARDLTPEAKSRNQVVHQKIMEDDLLRRKLDPKATFRREAARDVIANNAFNAMAREGVGGLSQATGIEEKRERALWNSMVGKLRPMVTDPRIPVSERRKYADAVMNVMQYGLDGLPAEIFMQSPVVYKEIAGRLGLRGWQHFTENNPQPTPSSSRTR